MKKLLLLFVFGIMLNGRNTVAAQNLSIEETKEKLCSHKWFLRRLERNGKMYTVPKELQGLKMVFRSNGTVYSYLPADKESSSEIWTWSITKSILTIQKRSGKTVDFYRLEDFIGYKLYLTDTEGKNNYTLVFEQADKIEVLNRTEKVEIGKQVWATENLNTTRFRNGDFIAEAKTAVEWKLAAESGKPAWCYSKNDPMNGPLYGKLYNWHAVNDPRGLAPEGWHVPSKEEIDLLMQFLGGKDVAAVKMKTEDFWMKNGGGNNISGFSAMPAGKRYNNGDFAEFNFGGYFWTTTLNSYDGGKKYAHHFLMQAGHSILMNGHMALLGYGCSVRLIKD